MAVSARWLPHVTASLGARELVDEGTLADSEDTTSSDVCTCCAMTGCSIYHCSRMLCTTEADRAQSGILD
jgi:hypothetical protein